MTAPVPIRLMALGGFASGAGMRLLDPILPAVARDFETTVSEAAVLIAAFMLAYGCTQLVAGPLGDRLGKLRVASLGLILYGLASLGGALAGGLSDLALIRVASGMAAGAVIPLLIAHIGDNTPYEDRQALLGRFATGMVMAQLLAGPLSGIVADWAGWRASFLVLGLFALGVGATLAALLWRQGGPRAASGASGMAGYRLLAGRAAARRLLAVTFFNGLLLFGGAFPFVGSFLVEGFGLSSGEAGLTAAGFGLSLIHI